jgi:hypothetical protein
MSHHLNRLYIVDASREDPTERWIVAAFGRRDDAEKFTDDVGGEIHTVNDDGLPELIEKWQDGNDLAQARHHARQMIASATGELDSVAVTFGHALDIIERYAEQDAACAAYLRLRALTEQALCIIDEVIPAGVEKFEGVGISEYYRRNRQNLDDDMTLTR